MSRVLEGRPSPARQILNPAQSNPLLRYEYARGSNYEVDTRLTAALSALVPEGELNHADHRFFQITHLVTEYAWVAVHHTLCDLAAGLRAGNLVLAARHLDRCCGLSALPVATVRLLLDSLPQLSLLSMRAMFPPNTTGLDSPGARNLRRAGRAVWNEFEALMTRSGTNLDDLVSAADPGFSGDQERAALADVMARLHRFDARILEWKQVHLHMVWVLLGGQPDTAEELDHARQDPVSLRGRPISDLERMAARPLFPRLWQQSTKVFRRVVDGDEASRIPAINNVAPGGTPMTEPGHEAVSHPISADRVLLQELDAAGAADIVAGRVLPGQAWAEGYPLEGTKVAAGMVVRLVRSGGYRPGFGMYQIVDRMSGQVVGDVGFHSSPDESGSVEIGYGLVPGHRGKGLATEAVRALAAWAFRQTGVAELRAETDVHHAASHGVLVRAGFELLAVEGETRRYVLRRGRLTR